MHQNRDNSYLAEIIRALKQLDGAGSLKEINSTIEQNKTMPYINTNLNWKNNVSATIQRHCIQTRSYRGAENLFYSVFGLGEGFWGLVEYKSNIEGQAVNPIEQREIKMIFNDSNLSQTEKEAIIMARRGQGIFRERLINKYKSCIVTGISDERLLVASHIKPWRSADNFERLSSDNGLLLSPLYDKLFDLGLITFKVNGCISVSNQLSEKDKNLIKIDEQYNYLKDISNNLRKNIEYHNDKVFLK